MAPGWRLSDRPLYGPDRTVAEWHTPPPPDPIFARRVKNFQWEKFGVVAIGLAVLIPLLTVGFKHHLGGLIGAFMNPWGILCGWVWTRRPPVSVKHLMDLPPSPGQFPVRVNYSADNFAYGSDAGIVTIDGPWINFQGLESEFAFQRAQAEVEVHAFQRSSNRDNLQLRFWESGHVYSIGVRPFDQVEGVGRGYRRSFCATAGYWKCLSDKAAGEPTLPPLAPKATTLQRASRARLLCMVMPTFPLAAFLIWYGIHGYGEFWPCSLIVCGCISWFISLGANQMSKRLTLLHLLANPPIRPVPRQISFPTGVQDSENQVKVSLASNSNDGSTA